MQIMNTDDGWKSPWGFLKNEFGYQKVLLPYNPRNESSLKKVGYNESP